MKFILVNRQILLSDWIGLSTTGKESDIAFVEISLDNAVSHQLWWQRYVHVRFQIRIFPKQLVQDYSALDWVIKLPEQNSNNEHIEVLSSEQFQQLLNFWQSYPDPQLSNLHQFIGGTGSRPQKDLNCPGKMLN